MVTKALKNTNIFYGRVCFGMVAEATPLQLSVLNEGLALASCQTPIKFPTKKGDQRLATHLSCLSLSSSFHQPPLVPPLKG